MKQGLETRILKVVQRLFGRERAHYLSLVVLLIKRELKVKYRGTVLGYLWSMINPLLFMIIISSVLGGLVRGIEHYNVYLLTGILLWNLTTLSITQGASSIVQGEGLVKKVKIPLWIFPMVSLGTGLINFVLALGPFLIVCAVKEVWPPVEFVALPIFLFVYFSFLYGIGLLLSTLNVFFRDVSHVLEPVLQILFYGTPILYSRTTLDLSSQISFLLELNPFVYFIELGRSLLFNGPAPIGLAHYVVVPVLASLSLACGLLVYKFNKRKIVFYL